MRYSFQILFLSLILSLADTDRVLAKNKNLEILRDLDTEIKKVDEYREKKEKKIDFLKNIFNKTKDVDHKFELSSDLFEEYKVFQFDSAYVYAKISKKLALDSDNKNNIAIASSQQLFCYTSIGYFKEGAELISNFSPEGVSSSALANFYINCYLYYQNLRIFVKGSKSLDQIYLADQKKYLDLALEYLKNDSFKTRFYKATYNVLNNLITEETIVELKSLLKGDNISDRDRAIIYSLLGISFNTLNNRESAIYYTALSAICDIEGAIYETTAAKMLANYMVDQGDIKRASRYINLAWSDANRYNTHIRKLEIQSILPEIEKLRYNGIDKQRINLILFSSIIVILLITVIVMYRNIRKRNLSLRTARKEIEKRASELAEKNSQLSNINKELDETNRIKDSYIIETLYGDSGFVDRVEKSCKIFERKIRAKQYSDLQNILRDIDIKRERARMSTSFDSAFLKLFPNFVDEYNKLFPSESRVVLNENSVLLPEMRIFALIKLGIEDINKISNYLNLSVNTIYVYKAKVKAKALVPKEEFEDYIRRIE